MSRMLYKTCGLRLYSTRVLISVGGAGTVNHSRKVLTRHSERHICLWFMGSKSDVLSWDYGLLYERSLVVLLLYLSLVPLWDEHKTREQAASWFLFRCLEFCNWFPLSKVYFRLQRLIPRSVRLESNNAACSTSRSQRQPRLGRWKIESGLDENGTEAAAVTVAATAVAVGISWV